LARSGGGGGKGKGGTSKKNGRQKPGNRRFVPLRKKRETRIATELAELRKKILVFGSIKEKTDKPKTEPMKANPKKGVGEESRHSASLLTPR